MKESVLDPYKITLLSNLKFGQKAWSRGIVQKRILRSLLFGEAFLFAEATPGESKLHYSQTHIIKQEEEKKF